LDKVENALLETGRLVGSVMMVSVFQCGWGRPVMVSQTVQMDQMNPLPLVVHLPVPVIQTFVSLMDRRFSQIKTVETALIDMAVLPGFLVGAATVDSVCIRSMSVMVDQTVQMDQMNPPPHVVHLSVPVIQTFVFHLYRIFSQVKTVETALIYYMVGAATMDSV